MNNLIVYPLLILIVVGLFYQAYTIPSSIDLSGSDSTSQDISGSQTLNGTSQDLELEQGSLSLDFNMTVGLVAIIIGAIALGLIGIQVLGSGLSDRSVKIIWSGIVYYGLWAVFSVLAFNPISLIPYFGVFIWFLLTFFYTLGVFGRMEN